MITYNTRKMVTYKTTDTHPGTLPTATIYLDGLLCFCFDDAEKCTIGVNRAVGEEHKWKLSIVNLKTRKSILERNHLNTKDPGEIHIDVTGGTTGGTYVYNGPDHVSIPIQGERRFNLENSWIDLEGQRGHNKHLDHDANVFWPRFKVNEGLFCARKLSTATFELRNGKPVVNPLGKIALQVVADMFLDPGNPQSEIRITFPDMSISLNNENRYAIKITNNCAPKRVPDIDFPLHYRAFSSAFVSKRGMRPDEKFRLVRCQNGTTSSLIGPIGDEIDSASDKAPCMAIALGQTSAFKA